MRVALTTLWFALPGLLLAMTGGCYYDDGRSGEPAPVEPEIFQAAIDPGATLRQEPGAGAGVFVEYLGAGDWHVFTTCDTDLSGYDCSWDIVATVGEGAEIRDVRGESLEAGDYVFSDYGYDAQLVGFTGSDFDHMYFRTDSGEPVRIEAYLDGIPDARFIYWIGDGAVHDGAPSNPVDFVPGAE